MAVKMRPARMSSAEYWRRRESQRRKERIADEKERAKLLQEIYRTAVDQMTREVESFFQRYARDEQITLADARRRVSLLDMKEYERLAKQYVESKDFSPEANRQMKLYNLTMKANRLELLRNRLGLEMVKMTNDTQTEISRALVERSLETFEEYAGILGDSVRDPSALAVAISEEPFKGAKWSERLWGTNQKGLYDSVTKTLENALISGKNARQLASSLRKQYGISLYEAQRLMVTEMARCQTEAAKLSMEVNGNEYYMVLTANAMGPCGECSDLEDQTTRDPIPVKDMEPGVNAPPLHPSCHCATAPWWDEGKYQEWLDSGDARRGVDYSNYEDLALGLPRTSYDFLKSTHPPVVSPQERIKRRNLKADTEQWERYKQVLGGEAPQSIEEFQKIKYNNNKSSYGSLKHMYRIANQYEHNSGWMPASKITELHDEAVKQKALFNSAGRNGSNIGIMQFDGHMYYANSRATVVDDPIFKSFIRNGGTLKKLIPSQRHKRFATKLFDHYRGADSERKLFEYASRLSDNGEPHEINLLSEKEMCESCKFVMEQFKRRYPNVNVNVVSHKSNLAKKNKKRNPVFEYDVKKRYNETKK